MKKYEGLFIFNVDESSVNDMIEKISAEISAQGGKAGTITKMGKRNFARTPDKKVTSGQYVNIAFEAEPASIQVLRSRFAMNHNIYRVGFTDYHSTSI